MNQMKSTIPMIARVTPQEASKPESQSAAPMRFVPDTLEEVQRIARLFYYSGLMKKSFYYDPSPDGVKSAIAGITVMIMYGAELGLSPMQAMRSMHVIEGQSSLSAEGCVAILKRSPKCLYFRVTSESDNHCSAETVRIENDGSKSPVHKLTVKIWWDDPKNIPEPTAGLLYVLPTYDKKGNLAPAWARTPGRMVKARCTMWLAHNVYEDVVLGLYSVEEVVDFADRRSDSQRVDDIFSMVDDVPARPGRVEANDEPAEAPSQEPTTPVVDRGVDAAALLEEIKVANNDSDWESLKARAAGFVGTEFHGAMQEAWRGNPASPRAKKAAES